MAKLRIYGENAFTFRFFEDVIQNNNVLRLLGNLKRFDRPWNEFPVAEISVVAEPEVWLFPSLGRRDGFGEPDAILVIDQHAFWFEVETDVDFKSVKQPSFRQLARFHYAARALQRGSSLEKRGSVYAGTTVSDRNKKKNARLRVPRGEASSFLQELGGIHAHHYVLCSIYKPQGGGDWRADLPGRASTMFSDWDQIAGFSDPSERFPLERTWYVCWEGDLKQFAKDRDPLADCVLIKRDHASRDQP